MNPPSFDQQILLEAAASDGLHFPNATFDDQ